MSNLATKFTRLKRSLGGNREKTGFEYTFGMPVEEEHYLTPPNRETTRLLSELEFAMRLSGAEEKKYDSLLDEVLEYLLAAVKEDGTLTKAHCAKAEEMLQREGWQDLTAVKEGNFYLNTAFMSGGLGKMIGAAYMAKWLYPDLMTELDPDALFTQWMAYQGFEPNAQHYYHVPAQDAAA